MFINIIAPFREGRLTSSGDSDNPSDCLSSRSEQLDASQTKLITAEENWARNTITTSTTEIKCDNRHLDVLLSDIIDNFWYLKEPKVINFISISWTNKF